MSGPQAYPLAWPAGRPRTPARQRKIGRFTAQGRPIGMAQALDRVEAEVARLGGIYPLLSSDVLLRLDGRPRSGQPQPDDPGVCLYFQMGGKPYAMACDAYTKVEQNVAAIAAHIEATRAITRHGVATAAETLQAFMALPAPGGRHWTAVLGLGKDATVDEVKAAHRRLLVERHPDRGGTDADMAEINAARDQALRGRQ